jgi:hypothetical protein
MQRTTKTRDQQYKTYSIKNNVTPRSIAWWMKFIEIPPHRIVKRWAAHLR